MRDPFEGVDADGMIRTGVARARVPAVFEPVVADAVVEFRRVQPPSAALLLYGSVATGMARPGESDVDLLVVDGVPGMAVDVGSRLSSRYAGLCRGVEVGQAWRADVVGPGDESYGNRVFLRHYCVPLAGPDVVRSRAPFAADADAARGFNGDIRRCLQRWRRDGADARRVARKTLVAAAGLVSVRTGGWTTDRATAADAWVSVDRDEAVALRTLLGWAAGSPAGADDLTAALADGGIVPTIAERFAVEIGLWDD